jgi:hypothetical protein
MTGSEHGLGSSSQVDAPLLRIMGEILKPYNVFDTVVGGGRGGDDQSDYFQLLKGSSSGPDGKSTH